MKKILILCLALSGVNLFAQQRTSFKIYQNTDFFQTVLNEWWKNQRNEVDVVNFNRVSIAVAYKFRLSHELELFIPEFSKPAEDMSFPFNYEINKDPRWQSKANSYSFRYEISKVLTKGLKPLQFSVGAGVNPYFVAVENIPTTPIAAYPSSRKWYGSTLNFTPRVTYDLTERLYLDLSVPVKVFDYRFQKEHVENPNIPLRQQVNLTQQVIFFERAYTIRFGVGYWLGMRKRR
jgi:hypothetical protein